MGPPSDQMPLKSFPFYLDETWARGNWLNSALTDCRNLPSKFF